MTTIETMNRPKLHESIINKEDCLFLDVDDAQAARAACKIISSHANGAKRRMSVIRKETEKLLWPSKNHSVNRHRKRKDKNQLFWSNRLGFIRVIILRINPRQL